MANRHSFRAVLLTAVIYLISSALIPVASAADEGFEFYPDGTYDRDIPSPQEIIGFQMGDRPVHHSEAVEYFRTLSEHSPRVQFHTYGETYEGRQLVYAVISSKENMEQLESIRSGLGKLADPRRLSSSGEAERIIQNSPAQAWLLYSIHGDELSSTDAAVQVLYQLAAGTDKTTRSLLDSLVICIDPLQNPDGRERFLAQVEQWQSGVPVSDAQSIQHTTVWPWGRGNHYLFDLNRDWFPLVNTESRARITALRKWHPQLVVDAHEMGGYSTYLFPPAREPINRNIPEHIRKKWIPLFAADHAEAFNEHGWSYYTKEWNDDWYPGYGSSWGRYQDAVGILYEQAGVDGTLLRQPGEKTLTYREAVHHHFVSSITNLKTTVNHRKDLLSDYYQSRKSHLDDFVRSETRVYLFLPGENSSRTEHFVNTLLIQDIEVHRASESFALAETRDYWSEKRESRRFPAGTYIVRLDQPLRPYIEAILEFDPRMVTEALQQERKSLLNGDGSTMYEVTTWSLPIAYGLEAFSSLRFPDVSLEPVTEITTKTGQVLNPSPEYGYLIPYEDAAARDVLIGLLQDGFVIRAAREPFTLNNNEYDRGTLLIRNEENPPGVKDSLVQIAKRTGLTIIGTNTALSDEGPDLGGGEFVLVTRPKPAILTGSGISTYSFGTIWHMLDRQLDLRHSILNVDRFSGFDLRKYNVLLLPSSDDYERLLGEHGTEKLKSWVKGGGTLIALNNAAGFMADSAGTLSRVRLRRQSLQDLQVYLRAVVEERKADSVSIDSAAIWEGKDYSEFRKFPGSQAEEDLEQLRHQDKRMRLFKPQGTYMKAVLDETHWLAFGCEQQVPAFMYTSYAYLSKSPVETVGRLAPASGLRVSGLLWPEARQRWANTAYLTRESAGRGQIILFASEPFFRGYHHSTGKLLQNAILFGPGFGTRQPVPLDN